MLETTYSLSKLKEETKEEIDKTHKELSFLQENLENNRIVLNGFQENLNNLQTEFNFYNQSLSNTQINLGNLNTKIETVHKTLEKQFALEQESVSAKILDVSGQMNNLKEKVKDTENVLNPFPRKVFSIEVRIEELTRYFGLKFNRTGENLTKFEFMFFIDELETVIQEPLSNLKLISEENKKLLAPFISSLLIDFKNISNKIPFYQKRVLFSPLNILY